MVVQTPPMGWNSWNTFGENINEQLIKDVADVMVSEGLKDCGYEYLVIDDCWALKERDENGRLVPDPEKFPSGIKPVADYVHSKGLKFGMYSCAGTLTCAGYPSSFEHEFTDAETFAEWGVDFLKYDYCNKPITVDGHALYKRMGVALANCGRDILFSACSWGADETKKWIKSTGANMWRSTGDIFDSWKSFKDLALKAPQSIKYSAPNCFADMDMMTVGMHGGGNVGVDAGCTDEEYFMHFAFWALLGSPLMIGCDVRNMSEETKKTLTNKEIIAINQDIACNQPYIANWNGAYEDDFVHEKLVYARLLNDGDIAIGIFDFSDEGDKIWPNKVMFNLDMLGLPESTGKTLLLHDVRTGEEIKVTNGVYGEPLKAHSCRLFRAKIIDK